MINAKEMLLSDVLAEYIKAEKRILLLKYTICGVSIINIILIILVLLLI